MSKISILGHHFSKTELSENIKNIPRFTYRQGFTRLTNESHFFPLRSDTYWGCCIRCGQSMLFQYMLKFYHNQNKTKDEKNSLISETEVNAQILQDFNDVPDVRFSIHNFCREITKLGGHEGQYVSVSKLAVVIKNLLTPDYPVYVSENSTIVKDHIEPLFESGKTVLCLIPMKCGINTFDQEFAPLIQLATGFDTGLGFISGYKRRAYYFVGFDFEKFYYFDPHETKSFVSQVDDYKSYYEPELKSISLKDISPSLMLCFSWDTKEQMEETFYILSTLPGTYPIVFIDHQYEPKLLENTENTWELIEHDV